MKWLKSALEQVGLINPKISITAQELEKLWEDDYVDLWLRPKELKGLSKQELRREKRIFETIFYFWAAYPTSDRVEIFYALNSIGHCWTTKPRPYGFGSKSKSDSVSRNNWLKRYAVVVRGLQELMDEQEELAFVPRGFRQIFLKAGKTVVGFKYVLDVVLAMSKEIWLEERKAYLILVEAIGLNEANHVMRLFHEMLLNNVYVRPDAAGWYARVKKRS